MTNFYQVYLANIGVVITVLAIYLCLPFSGIKLKKPGIVLAVVYAIVSGVIFLGCLYAGAVVLFMTFWLAMALGNWAISLFLFIALAIALMAMYANYLTFNYLAKTYPHLITVSSKTALKVTSALIVFTQIGSIFLFEKFELFYKSPKIAMGYIDKTGKIVITPAFGDVEKFHNGEAITWPSNANPSFSSEPSNPESYLVIDRSGKVKKSITPKERAELRDKFIKNHLEDPLEPYLEYQYKGFPGEYIEGLKIIPEENYGQNYVDKNGKVLLTKKVMHAREFSEGLAAVNPSMQWGYIDHAGEIVIPPQFQRIGPFHEGLAPVAISNPSTDDRYATCNTKDDLLYGYINKKGEFVIPPMFLHACPFSEGLAGVQVDLNKMPDLKRAQKILKRHLYNRDYSEIR